MYDSYVNTVMNNYPRPLHQARSHPQSIGCYNECSSLVTDVNSYYQNIPQQSEPIPRCVPRMLFQKFNSPGALSDSVNNRRFFADSPLVTSPSVSGYSVSPFATLPRRCQYNASNVVPTSVPPLPIVLSPNNGLQNGHSPCKIQMNNRIKDQMEQFSPMKSNTIAKENSLKPTNLDVSLTTAVTPSHTVITDPQCSQRLSQTSPGYYDVKQVCFKFFAKL